MTDTTNPRVTHAALMKDNAYRTAFTAICRHALPYMADDAYHSDLLYDAEHATRLNPGDRFYLLVRKLGTNVYAYGDDAVKNCDPSKTDGQAVLKIIRGTCDTFHVTVLYDLKCGYRM